MGRITIRQPGLYSVLVVEVSGMSQVEEESRDLALLCRGQGGDVLLDFFNAHNAENTTLSNPEQA